MDINWQIAMIAIRMKKFYKKTGRRVHVDGKSPVGFDKKKLESFNCHNTGHFARECTAKGTHDGKKKRDSFYQHQEAGKQEKNQMGLLTMDDVWTNTDRINHSNQFVPRPVQLNTDLDSRYLPGHQTALVLKDHREIRDLLLRPQQVITGETLDQTPIVIDHPLKNMVDRGIFDSGCSGHMTGNKDQLEDFEEFNGGSVTFGGSKGYISAFSDSDYGGSNLDRKSTTGGCQFLGQRLISWQCKKQTIVATSTTEAEYVVAANCCGQA
ncbi:putative ribonuclease H-like domain-containing protein [Tanacetum coccineum]